MRRELDAAVRAEDRAALAPRHNHDYVSHLAQDADPRFTLCGEPWQGWQASEEASGAAVHLGHSVLPPHMPAKQGDTVRQCQAYFRKALSS